METFSEILNEASSTKDTITLGKYPMVMSVYNDGDIRIKLWPTKSDHLTEIESDPDIRKNVVKEFEALWKKKFKFEIVEDSRESKDKGGYIFKIYPTDLLELIKSTLKR